MATAADGGIVAPTRMASAGAAGVPVKGGGHVRPPADKSPTSAVEKEEEEERHEEVNAPVDLVCPKHKFEPSLAPSGLDTIPDSSLALSFLMRRRRRGRARYAPFPCSGCTTHAPDLSPGLSASLPGGANLSLGGRGASGQFVCPHCKSVFPNRDALAMHMLDSVRSDGVCGGGGAGGANGGAISSSVTSANASPPCAAGGLNGGVSSVSSSVTAVVSAPGACPTGTGVAVPTVAQTGAPVTCRVCAKTLPSLDSLAMHMLAHAHQEGLHSVMQRVASHYSDLLQHSFAPPVPPPAALPPHLSVSTVVGPMSQLSPDRRSPVDAKPSVSSSSANAEGMEESADAEGGSAGGEQALVVVKVEEEELEEQCPGEEEEEDAEDGAETASVAVDETQEAGENVSGPTPTVEDLEEDEVDECVGGRGVMFPFVCRHCLVAFADRTMFCLHMGLHNVNHPWQCNMCGKACSGRHEFASHVLHF